jgi:transcriptional regulator of acetoin/glycerol metabolism
MILRALEQTNFRKGKAAALLGISPNTLYRKRKKYNL